MTSHLKRWLTGIVGVPFIGAVLFYGTEQLFTLLVVLLILFVAWEYAVLVFGRGFSWEKTQMLAGAVLMPAAFATADLHYILLVITLMVALAFFFFLLQIKGDSFDLTPVCKVILGIAYFPLALSHFIFLRSSPDGSLWVALVLIIAFTGDMAAYYTGRMFGNAKLLPQVSPGKTVEGAIGGYLGSLVCVVIFQQVFYPRLSIPHALILGFLGNTLSQLGDLCESAVKRVAGVKDSGRLLPGHGGFMDRLDCLAFITPFTYYYRLFLLGG